MEPLKEHYTLFIFGNFKGRMAEGEILQPLMPITCGETLKYVYEPYTMTVQFDTDIPNEELVEYIKTTYKSSEVEYYLVPKGQEMSVRLPKKIMDNLNDLENDTDRVTYLYTKFNVKESQSSADDFDKLIQMFMQGGDDMVDFFEDEDVDPMLKPKEKKPTLDDLLDKMIDGEALSLSEQDLLTQYSNEYK